MISIIKKAGFRYVNGNDLDVNHFTLTTAEIENSEEATTLSDVTAFDIKETYQVYVKDYNTMIKKLKSIVSEAKRKYNLTNFYFSVEPDEAGYFFNLNFVLKGV